MGTSPAIMLISVDLPQPLGPNTETILCFGISRLKSSYSGQPAKYLVNPRMVMWVPAGPGWNSRTGTSAKTGALITADMTHSNKFHVQETPAHTPLSSKGRGSGSASPQAQRPPRGAES